MDFEYIIVQAGGKGTRLKHLTRNKPKALVPVHNLPMLFHVFKKYKNKKFVIIGDYKYDVLKKYLNAFADVDYKLIDARGLHGTCAGITKAIETIDDDSSFMLMWSDLVLPDNFETLSLKESNYIGISKSFPCRWRYHNKMLEEVSSEEEGVAGLFIFKDKNFIKDVPLEGEFVRYLQGKNIKFEELSLLGTKEFGLIEEYNKLEATKCRPFNKIRFFDDYIIKEPVDKQGEQLAVRERAWYEKVKDYEFEHLPKIYTLNPLMMEKIKGNNIYEFDKLSYNEKGQVLKKIVNCLKSLHELGEIDSIKDSFDDAYIDKTIKRLEKVENLVPFANDEVIIINDKEYKNPLKHFDKIKEGINKYFPEKFVFLHGDNTFSNILLSEDNRPVLIDPRGYFGKTEFYGDVAYDWAKLYYSIIGNYDQFNLKRFDLTITENDVNLTIESSNWEDCEDLFFELVGNEISKEQIELIHAIIWLSLTTYAWQDYDSICGAFYKGVMLCEKFI